MSQKQAGAIDDLTSSNPSFDPVRDDALGHAREESGVLGDLPVINRRDQDDIKGILRRESTKGRRKANSGEMQRLATGQSLGSQQPYIGPNAYARVSGEESPERYPYAQVYPTRSEGSGQQQPYVNQPQHLTPGFNPNAALPAVPGQPQRSLSNPYNRQSNSGQSAMSWKKGPYEEV